MDGVAIGGRNWRRDVWNGTMNVPAIHGWRNLWMACNILLEYMLSISFHECSVRKFSRRYIDISEERKIMSATVGRSTRLCDSYSG